MELQKEAQESIDKDNHEIMVKRMKRLLVERLKHQRFLNKIDEDIKNLELGKEPEFYED